MKPTARFSNKQFNFWEKFTFCFNKGWFKEVVERTFRTFILTFKNRFVKNLTESVQKLLPWAHTKTFIQNTLPYLKPHSGGSGHFETDSSTENSTSNYSNITIHFLLCCTGRPVRHDRQGVTKFIHAVDMKKTYNISCCCSFFLNLRWYCFHSISLFGINKLFFGMSL